VLLALGIPAGASSNHSDSHSSSDKTSQDHSRDESDDDHDHGYGNDDREDKSKDKDKDNNEVVDPATEVDRDDPIDVDEPDDVEDQTNPDESIDEETRADDSLVEQTETVDVVTDDEPESSNEEIDGVSDVTTTDPAFNSDPVAAPDVESKQPADPSLETSSETTDTPEASSVEVVFDPVVAESSIITVDEKPIETLTDEVDVEAAAVEPVASSNQKPSDTVEAEDSKSKTDRDESASDHDKGYGNDEKESKTKEDKAQGPPTEVPVPDVESVPEPAEVDPSTEAPPEPTAGPADSPAATSEPVLQTPDTAPTTLPVEDDLLILASHAPAPEAQPTEISDPGPDVTALVATEQIRFPQSVLAAPNAASVPAGAGSLLGPIGRMLLPPAGLALVDLLADTDAPVLVGSNSESVAEAAQQAAGLVAVPAAALTALTLLGWALKPAAIKVSAFVAGRIG